MKSKLRLIALSQSKALTKITRIFLHMSNKQKSSRYFCVCQQKLYDDHAIEKPRYFCKQLAKRVKSSPWDLVHEQFEERWLLAQYPDLKWKKKRMLLCHQLALPIRSQFIMKLKDKWRELQQYIKGKLIETSYKDILTNPSIGELAVDSPNNSKCHAEGGNGQCQIWHSSKEGYFNKQLSIMFKPSETIIV